MSFGEYADYYDLLYQDKDYLGEASYIMGLIEQYAPGSRNLLELGCGTGKHAELLADNGYCVHGIDMSEGMLKEAETRAKKRKDDLLSFEQADVREFVEDNKYDSAISLFHVLSYVNNDQDLLTVLKNVNRCIKTAGIFIFDTWYGPAVLYQKPETRIKRLSNEKINVTRIAESVLKEDENICEVNYDIFIEDKRTQRITEIKELHSMRYFFLKEIEYLSQQAGFRCIASFESFTDSVLSKQTWSSCFILKKEDFI